MLKPVSEQSLTDEREVTYPLYYGFLPLYLKRLFFIIN